MDDAFSHQLSMTILMTPDMANFQAMCTAAPSSNTGPWPTPAPAATQATTW